MEKYKNILQKLIKLMLFVIFIEIFVYLYFYLNSISLTVFFLKSTYAKIIIYFIYFIFFYMTIFFYLKQFNLYLFISSLINKKDIVIDIIKTKKEDNSTWKNIILNIESTRHTSILSKIKDLDTESEINFPKYNREHNFNIVFLHKIREFIILFENILEKLKHMDSEGSSSENNKYQEFIQKKLYELYAYKYSFKIKLIFIKLSYYLIPYIVLIVALYHLPNLIENKAFINFFQGLGILFFAIPILLLLNNFIQWLKIYLFKEMNIVFSKSLLLDVSIQIVVTLIITITMVWGLNHLDTNPHKFHDIFIFFQDMVFHTEFIDGNLSNTYSMFQKPITINASNLTLVSKIIIGIMGTTIILNIINVFIKEYDQFFYEQKIKRYLLPPELLKVLGFFVVFIIYITYTYISISSYPYEKNDVNTTKTLVDNNITQFVAMDNIAKAIEEKASLEDILPFGLFLALFGTLLSISSRDIMSNYFAGLSMKMNHPYEQGDRVKIGNSEMLEVREIGIRNDKFYEISSNSIISIPHSQLATSSIKNYTHPTLDYRQQLTIWAKDKNNSPRKIEKVLLVSAFVNTGVKLPKIDARILSEIKNIDLNIFKDYKGRKHSEIERALSHRDFVKLRRIKWSKLVNQQTFRDFNYQWIEFCKTSSETIVDTINNTWKTLDKINESITNDNNKKYFFKNLFIEKLPINNFLQHRNDRTILSIKKALIAIVASVIEYQEKIKEDFPCQSDKYGIRRKNMIFNGKNKEVKDFADILVNISFYYYMLSNRLWELKEEQTTFSQKRKIDKAMTQILNVPRVTSIQELNDGNNYWKATLFVTLELSEQGDETLHHINMYVNKIWNIFLE